MKKILIVFGTRPEAIKMAPVVKALKAEKAFDTKVCVTAQHREMLDQVLELFDIMPDYDLDLMKADQDLFDVTANVLNGMNKVLSVFAPDLVLVHGDTTTTFATTLAAFYHKTDVGHVEAGLRTGNIYSPWPEEANRQLTSQIAKFHFAPTETSKQNLLKENIPEDRIVVTGNTVIDALKLALKKISKDEYLERKIIQTLTKHYPFSTTRKILLVTSHRRENFGEGFVNICHALKKIALKNPLVDVVYPVHLNPNVQKPVFEMLDEIINIHLIEPLTYETFVYLMNKSILILTDSGGIQEEAPSLGKPVLVMRDTTERPEAVKAGTVELVGTNTQLIVNKVNESLGFPKIDSKAIEDRNPYGKGNASKLLVMHLQKKWAT